MSARPQRDEQKQGLRPWLPLIFIVLAAALFFALGLQRYTSLEAFRANSDWLYYQVADNLALMLVIYMVAYAGIVTLSLPGATILTLVGGCLFGLWLGAAASAIGATIGATVIFLVARNALGRPLLACAGPRASELARGFRADAFSYLLFLRLVPAFPFFVVNLVPAFLGVRLRTFVLATFIGIIPGTFVYASVGAGLQSLLMSNQPISIGTVLTPPVITGLVGLALLSLLPVAWKAWRKHRGETRS